MKIIRNKKSLKPHDFLKELSICCDKTNSHLRRLLPTKIEEKLYDIDEKSRLRIVVSIYLDILDAALIFKAF